MSSKFSLKSDLLAMNVSWCPHELELYTNRSSITMSTIFTIILIITFLMGVIVQKAIFKLLNRLPQRAINQIIYPYMVQKSDRHIFKILYLNSSVFPLPFSFSGYVVFFHGTIFIVLHFDTMYLSCENLCRRILLLCNGFLQVCLCLFF